MQISIPRFEPLTPTFCSYLHLMKKKRQNKKNCLSHRPRLLRARACALCLNSNYRSKTYRQETAIVRWGNKSHFVHRVEKTKHDVGIYSTLSSPQNLVFRYWQISTTRYHVRYRQIYDDMQHRQIYDKQYRQIYADMRYQHRHTYDDMR